MTFKVSKYDVENVPIVYNMYMSHYKKKSTVVQDQNPKTILYLKLYSSGPLIF